MVLGDTIVISLHRLVDAFGQRKVGDGVVGITQGTRLGVERSLLGRRRHRRQAGDAPRVSGDAALGDLIDELLAVHDIARLDGLDGDRGPGLRRSHLIRHQRKGLAQGINELVDFRESVIVMQTEFELIAEQRS